MQSETKKLKQLFTVTIYTKQSFILFVLHVGNWNGRTLWRFL